MMIPLSSGVEHLRRAPGILLNDTMALAGKKVLRFHFHRMIINENGTIEGDDVECLHDMRVATRRMRAAFDLFQNYFIRGCITPYLHGLKTTARFLGKVRDLDVQMEIISSYLDSLENLAQQNVSEYLFYLTKKREKARGKMISYLQSEEYSVFKDEFMVFLDDPVMCVPRDANHMLVSDDVSQVILSCYDRVKQYNQVIPQATIKQLHQLRIAFKGLRYAVEFFREILGDSVELVIEQLKIMQDHLGNLNDVSVGINDVSRFIKKWEKNIDRKPIRERNSLQPIIQYLAYLYGEQHRLLSSFPEKWKHFSGDKFGKLFMASISAI